MTKIVGGPFDGMLLNEGGDDILAFPEVGIDKAVFVGPDDPLPIKKTIIHYYKLRDGEYRYEGTNQPTSGVGHT